jgi:small subunit ribosomal protein S4
VNIPSFILKANDTVAVDEPSKQLEIIHLALKSGKRGEVPEWLRVDKVKLSGQVVSVPSREQIATPVNEQLIVELYSK